MPKRLVLFGEQRSGTSLLVDLLNTQPGVVMRTGLLTRGLQSLYEHGARDSTRPLPAKLARPTRATLEKASIQMGHPALIEARTPVTMADLVCAALDGSGRAARPTVVGSKEHAPTELSAGLLRDRRLHVALIVRDARDVILSRARRGDRALDSKALMWRRTARVALALDHPRSTVIRYEALATHPARALRPLMASLELELNEVALERWQLPRGHRTNTMFDDEMPRVSSIPVERWREFASAPPVRAAGWICRRELAGLGYADGPPLEAFERRRMRVREAAAQARYRLGSAWRRLRAERRRRA